MTACIDIHGDTGCDRKALCSQHFGAVAQLGEHLLCKQGPRLQVHMVSDVASLLSATECNPHMHESWERASAIGSREPA